MQVSSLHIVIKLWTKRIFLLILSLLLGSFSLLSLTHSIAANDEVSLDQQTGRIEIHLEASKSGRSWNGVEFAAYRCADVDLQASKLEYLEPYTDCRLDADSLYSSQAIEEAITFLSSRKTEPTAKAAVNNEGVAAFENLPFGLYLFCVSQPAEYDLIGSFLTVLPLWNEQEERYETSLSVRAKANALPDLQIRKIDSSSLTITGREFVFAAYTDKELTQMSASVSGNTQNGLATFRPCLGQTIYIKEIKAPSGYVLSDRIVKVSMDIDGSVFVDNVKKKPDQDLVITVEYENKSVPPADQDSGTSQKPGPAPENQKPSTGQTQTGTPGPTGQAPAYPSSKPSTGTWSGQSTWLMICVAAIASLGLLLVCSLIYRKDQHSSR